MPTATHSWEGSSEHARGRQAWGDGSADRTTSVCVSLTAREEKRKKLYDDAVAWLTTAVSRRNFGLLLLGVVVFAWVSSNFLTHVRPPPPNTFPFILL